MDTGSSRRRIAVGIGAMVAGAGLLVGALGGGAGAAPTQDPTPSTSEVPDNQTCSDLAPEGADWTELKVEPVVSGTYDDGTLEVTLVVTGDVFSWTSNIGVDAVFVKGGPGGLLYTYDPEAMADAGLHAPVNPRNNMFFGLSHVSFCYDEDDGTTTTEKDTTTTTEKDTTTTTEKDTTTTTEKDTTTTTEGEETTTTVAGETTTTMAGVTTTVVSDGDELPRTGSSSGALIALAGVLLAGGTALVAGTKWRRAQQ